MDMEVLKQNNTDLSFYLSVNIDQFSPSKSSSNYQQMQIASVTQNILIFVAIWSFSWF